MPDTNDGRNTLSLKLNVIIGSVRPGRGGAPIAAWIDERAREHGGFDVELVDLADFHLPLLDEPAHPRLQQYEHDHTKRWAASVDSADAYIFVTPEYDYFAPASLVNAVQVVLNEWAYKPAGIVSYGGLAGGLRSTQVLRQLLGNVNVHALPQSVGIPMFPQYIDEGVFAPNELASKTADLMLDELHRWAVALQPLRGSTSE